MKLSMFHKQQGIKMKLSDIAESLRRDALAHLGEIQSQRLGQGAECNLRAELLDDAAKGAPNVEWHLQIKREGKLPTEDTPAYKRWLSELSTFCKQSYFNVPSHCKPAMQAGKHRYAAAFVWTEHAEIPSVSPAPAPIVNLVAKEIHITPIPSTPKEIAAWAKTLGQGVQIRNVNVFTGEL